MKSRLLTSIAVTVAAILAAGLSWLAALVIFIPIIKTGVVAVRVIVWLLSPVVVSLGFASGAWLAVRWLRGARDSFVRLWLWPLVGCSAGAAVVFWFGPMLIVFGAFAGGAAAVTLREAAQALRKTHPAGTDRSDSTFFPAPEFPLEESGAWTGDDPDSTA